MRLTKVIPSRRVTVHATWCMSDYMQAGALKYARALLRLKPMGERCWWCSYQFMPSDVVALAHFTGKGNRTICQECAARLIETPAPELSGDEPKGD